MTGDSTDRVDAPYLFLCALLWRKHALNEAMDELVNALESPDPDLNLLVHLLMEESDPSARNALAAYACRRWQTS
jgi:hypothetical protein